MWYNDVYCMRGLRCWSAVVRLLGLGVRIPSGVCKSVSCECCMLSGVSCCSLTQGIPTEVTCIAECDSETSITRRPWPSRDAMEKIFYMFKLFKLATMYCARFQDSTAL